jgi:phospholipase/lecithinase/hemolysin
MRLPWRDESRAGTLSHMQRGATMKTSMKKLLVTVAAMLGAASAFASPQVSAIFAFGDSLSDNGNYYRLVDRLTPLTPQDGSPPLPYFFGRYSNGPVAVERLAADLGVPLHDFAVGGALTGLTNEDPRFPRSGVLAQVQAFTAAHEDLDDDALYFLWGGANDFLGATDLGAPGVAQAVIAAAITNLTQSVSLLYAHGARHFLLPNLPDLGLIPLNRGPQAALATQLTNIFNQAYARALLALEQHLTHADIQTADVAGLLRSAVANPGSFHLVNVTGACVSDPTFVCVLSSFNSGPAAGFLFWDAVHPTAAGHAALAALFASAVAPAGGATTADNAQEKDWLKRVEQKH